MKPVKLVIYSSISCVCTIVLCSSSLNPVFLKHNNKTLEDPKANTNPTSLHLTF